MGLRADWWSDRVLWQASGRFDIGPLLVVRAVTAERS